MHLFEIIDWLSYSCDIFPFFFSLLFSIKLFFQIHLLSNRIHLLFFNLYLYRIPHHLWNHTYKVQYLSSLDEMMVMGIFGADGEKELIRFSVWKKIKFIPYPILFIRFLMLPIDKFFNPLPHQSSKTSAYRRFKATFLNSSFSLDIN